MKTNSPNTPKTDFPDSDETARGQQPAVDDAVMEQVGMDIDGLQTSNKAGKHSTVEKMSASRPEFGEGRGALPVPGAFGDDEAHVITGRNAGPGTNQFQCNSCGRYFNTQGELSGHETECRLAKAATASGRDSLSQADRS